MSEQWYKFKNSLPLEQGDILNNVNVLIPSYELLQGETNLIDVATEDVIILTQSCDLTHEGKTNWVQVAKLIDVETLFPTLTNRTKSQLNSIIKGYVPSFHIIEECNITNYNFPRKLIDFREVFNLPVRYVMELAKRNDQLISLNSPYKEHLSQSYARFYMRVGLPTNISFY